MINVSLPRNAMTNYNNDSSSKDEKSIVKEVIVTCIYLHSTGHLVILTVFLHIKERVMNWHFHAMAFKFSWLGPLCLSPRFHTSLEFTQNHNEAEHFPGLTSPIGDWHTKVHARCSLEQHCVPSATMPKLSYHLCGRLLKHDTDVKIKFVIVSCGVEFVLHPSQILFVLHHSPEIVKCLNAMGTTQIGEKRDGFWLMTLPINGISSYSAH